jgi:hypothetical protein
MPSDIDWSMLDHDLSRQEPRGLWEDRIGFGVERIADPNRLEICFRVLPEIDWWKSVQVRNASDKVLLMLETQDEDRGPKCGSLDVRNLAGARIQFHKAKGLGIHTGMYQLPPDLTARGGTRIFFRWDEDR